MASMNSKPFDDVAAELLRDDPDLAAELLRGALEDDAAGELATLRRQFVKAGLVTEGERIAAGAGRVLSPKQGEALREFGEPSGGAGDAGPLSVERD